MLISVIQGVLIVVFWRLAAYVVIAALRDRLPPMAVRAAATAAGLVGLLIAAAFSHAMGRDWSRMDTTTLIAFIVAMILATAIFGPVARQVSQTGRRE